MSSTQQEVDLFGDAIPAADESAVAKPAKKTADKPPAGDKESSKASTENAAPTAEKVANKVVPDKRYFTISEAAELCGAKPHVLRYWESEFKQLSPVKRAGNRRYYQRQDIFLIRQIRELLHDQGFTIAGAKQALEGEGSKEKLTKNKQILREVRQELEKLLKLVK